MKRSLFLICVLAALLLTACSDTGSGGETKNTEPKTEDGTRQAYCQVCQKDVSWMGLTQEYVDTISITDENGETIDSAIMSGEVYETRHYYLTEDLTYNDSPVMGFFRGPGKGLTACLDLNDHNITTSATTSIFGNSGVLNVMGDGIVTGYSPNDHEGAAVRCGNRNANNGLNLYGGTYKKTADTNAASPVVAFDGAGRCVSVYEGVVIDAGDGVAVFADSSSAREKEGYLLLRGCTVYGDVKLAAMDVYLTRAEFIDCTVSGTVTVPEGHLVSLFGKVQIDKLSLAEDIRLTLGELTAGTAVGIDAVGVFTAKTEKAADYVAYFLPTDPAQKVSAVDSTLTCD